MKLKLRLVLVFFLLSAVPLAGIVVYGHRTSRAALHEAAELEARLLAREMESRVASVAGGLGRRLERLRDLPAGSWEGTGDAVLAAGALPQDVVSALAEAAPYFESLRFVPSPTSGTARAPEQARPPSQSAPRLHASPSVAPPARPIPPAAAAPMLPPLPRFQGFGLQEKEQEQLRRELEAIRAQVVRALADTARARAEADRTHADSKTRSTLRAAERATAGELARLTAEIEHSTEPAAEPAAELAAESALEPASETSPAEQVLRGEYSCPIEENGRVVGTVTARIRARELLQAVLGETRAEQGEIPFALDAGGQLYAANSTHAHRLESLPWLRRTAATSPDGVATVEDWIVVTRRDPVSGLRYGIARPLSDALAALRRASARNFGFGIGLVALALAGIFPLAGRMTRNLATLSDGATRLASGDLAARVPVRSQDEFGQLATTFNHMAEQICAHQQKLLEQEKLRKEEEIARRLLAAENERKSRELEDARAFQISLLPRELPAVPELELAVAMETATEVGGDYYDGQTLPGGEVVLAVGDATGHGAASATMVTVVKSFFVCEGGTAPPAEFLARANGRIQRMGLGRMAMALAVLRVCGRRLTLAAAGMPPALWRHGATGEIVELTLPGLPLGAMPGAAYQEIEIELAVGDHLLLMSDGFPELQSPTGEPLGYEAARAHFAVAATATDDVPAPAAEVLASLRDAARRWTAGGVPSDDVTFLVVRAV